MKNKTHRTPRSKRLKNIILDARTDRTIKTFAGFAMMMEGITGKPFSVILTEVLNSKEQTDSPPIAGEIIDNKENNSL